MKWVRSSAEALVSACARYAIARVRVEGIARYELWQTRFGDTPARLLSTHPTADEAKAALTREAA